LLIQFTAAIGQLKIEHNIQLAQTSIFRNVLYGCEINYKIKPFVKLGFGMNFFSDTKLDVLVPQINYYQQLAYKAPYLIISLLPVNFDKHEFAFGIGYSLRKVELNAPSYYKMLNDNEVIMQFYHSYSKFDSGLIYKFSYNYQISNMLFIGLVGQYNESFKDLQIDMYSIGINVGINLKKQNESKY